jgi:hypothetical protein
MIGPDASEALIAPAAARNRDAILAVLRTALPQSGTVLEVASGSGEHAIHFASALPSLTWLPSDPDPAARRSVIAHTRASGLSNIRRPLDLDAARPGWTTGAVAAVVCINMIHTAPWPATEGLMAGAAQVLAETGPLILYGPYHEGGRPTAGSNAAFDAALRAKNPAWGVRDLEAVSAEAGRHGLALARRIAMPANNLILIYRSMR